MKTFGELRKFVNDGNKDSRLQIYSHKRQVNVLNSEDLSLMNILFDDDEDEIHVYYVTRPGIANYSEYDVCKDSDEFDVAGLNSYAREAISILHEI